MASPYTSVSISGYNTNAPPDDGSNVASNALKWSNHIDKIGDPVRKLAQGIDTNVQAAFTAIYGLTDAEDKYGITPTDFSFLEGDVHRYGAIGDGVADDTVAIQAAIDFGGSQDVRIIADGLFLISSTIFFKKGVQHNWSMPIPVDIGLTPAKGFVWGGGNNDVMIELNQFQFSLFDNIICSNRVNNATGITGVLWRNDVDGQKIGNHNRYEGRIGIFGCAIGAQVGDNTGDGYASNIEENYVNEMYFFDCINPLIFDSVAVDNWTIKEFHSGWDPGIAAPGTRANIINVKGLGGGNQILWGFARVDDIITDNAAIQIDLGTLDLHHFRLEGNQTIQALAIGSNNISRGSMTITLVTNDTIKDSSNNVATLSHKSGVTLISCSFGTGNVQVTRPVIAIGTVFQDGFGFVTSTVNGIVNDIGTFTKANANSSITLGSETGNLSLATLSTQALTGIINLAADEIAATDDVGFTSITTAAGALIDNTDYDIATVALADGSSITLIIDYHIYRAHNASQNLSTCGTIYYSAHADVSGNIVAATPTIVHDTQALGVEYATLTITATMAEDEGANTVTPKIKQTNDVGDNLRAIFSLRIMGNIDVATTAPFASIT